MRRCRWCLRLLRDLNAHAPEATGRSSARWDASRRSLALHEVASDWACVPRTFALLPYRKRLVPPAAAPDAAEPDCGSRPASLLARSPASGCAQAWITSWRLPDAGAIRKCVRRSPAVRRLVGMSENYRASRVRVIEAAFVGTPLPACRSGTARRRCPRRRHRPQSPARGLAGCRRAGAGHRTQAHHGHRRLRRHAEDPARARARSRPSRSCARSPRRPSLPNPGWPTATTARTTRSTRARSSTTRVAWPAPTWT